MATSVVASQLPMRLPSMTDGVIEQSSKMPTSTYEVRKGGVVAQSQDGILTPPASVCGCLPETASETCSIHGESRARASSEQSVLDREAAKKAKKAAKAAKKQQKKEQRKAGGSESAAGTSEQQANTRKPTLAEQIVEGFVNKIRQDVEQATGTSSNVDAQGLIDRYIGFPTVVASSSAPVKPTPKASQGNLQRLAIQRSMPNLFSTHQPLYGHHPSMPSLPSTSLGQGHPSTLHSHLDKPLPPVPRSASAGSPPRRGLLTMRSMRSMKQSQPASDPRDVQASLERLITRHGRTAHMGVLDPSYRHFLNDSHTGVIYYKVHNHIAVVAGEPLCDDDRLDDLMFDFAQFRRRHGWGMAFIAASDDFARYARAKKWTSMHFGWDRILNPVTNALFNDATASSSTKRMLTQNRSLLNPAKGNLELGIYIPTLGRDTTLQAQLEGIYEAWRTDRNERRANAAQAFVTEYDPFSMPSMIFYLYTRDRKTGRPNGLAGLRRLGAHQGYQLDPCIAAPDCTLKGVSDLLIYASLALLRQAGITYMSFGIEPNDQLGAIDGLLQPVQSITRKAYKRCFSNLPLAGKKAFHEKFKPDENMDGLGMHLIFSGTVWANPRYGLAMAHMAHISLRRTLLPWAGRNKAKSAAVEANGAEEGTSADAVAVSKGETD